MKLQAILKLLSLPALRRQAAEKLPLEDLGQTHSAGHHSLPDTLRTRRSLKIIRAGTSRKGFKENMPSLEASAR